MIVLVRIALNSSDWTLTGTSGTLFVTGASGKWTKPFSMLYKLHSLA